MSKMQEHYKPENYLYMVGLHVNKRYSGKPFKSGLKINTVAGMSVHPVTNKCTFTFVEDTSYVECFRCGLVNIMEINHETN